MIAHLVGSLCIVLFLISTGIAADLGRCGAVYPIAERDALEEIHARARQVDWNKILDREKAKAKIKAWRPPNLVALPVAKNERTFNVDMTYATEFDVPDGKGKILYPKGYRFNPMEYLFLPNIIVVIDGTDPRQVDWFQRSVFAPDVRVMLLIVRGAWAELTQKLKRPVFYANKKIVDRLGLVAVPCTAMQRGTLMEIHEYPPELPNTRNTGKRWN